MAAAVDSASVEAVVSFSSPTDLASLYAESPQAGKAVAQFLGGPPAAIPGNYAAASPVDQVSPNSAPTLLILAEAIRWSPSVNPWNWLRRSRWRGYATTLSSFPVAGTI